jgi:hypothetical protein
MVESAPTKTLEQLYLFLSQRNGGGYLLVCSDDLEVRSDTIKYLCDRAVSEGEGPFGHIRLQSHFPNLIVPQLARALEEGRRSALLVEGLDDWISDEEKLLVLNLSREQLNQLNRPLVFFVMSRSFPILGNKASDFFSQRSGITLSLLSEKDPRQSIFLSSPSFVIEPIEKSYELRLSLLEEYYQSSLGVGLEPRRRALSFALPLAGLYFLFDCKERLTGLYDQWGDVWRTSKEPSELLLVGRICIRLGRLSTSEKYLLFNSIIEVLDARGGVVPTTALTYGLSVLYRAGYAECPEIGSEFFLITDEYAKERLAPIRRGIDALSIIPIGHADWLSSLAARVEHVLQCTSYSVTYCYEEMQSVLQLLAQAAKLGYQLPLFIKVKANAEFAHLMCFFSGAVEAVPYMNDAITYARALYNQHRDFRSSYVLGTVLLLSSQIQSLLGSKDARARAMKSVKEALSRFEESRIGFSSLAPDTQFTLGELLRKAYAFEKRLASLAGNQD